MLYPALVSTSIFVLFLAYRQSQRVADGGPGLFALCAVAIGFVLADGYPQVGQFAASATVLERFCFTLLLPLLFLNVKTYTNLSLPQWRAIRAFALGVPLLVGINGAFAQLAANAAVAPRFDSSIWVSYCFGLFIVVVSLWRFISTPRQRTTMVCLMLAPIAIVGADIGTRLLQWEPWGHSPAALATLLCLALMLLFARNLGTFAIRPVARTSLIDQAQDALVVVNTDERIVDHNVAAAELLGDAAQSFVGDDVAQRLPAELVSAVRAGSTNHIVIPWTRDAEEHWFEVRLNPLLVDQRQEGQLITLCNITRRHRTELALRESRSELQAANAQLEALANTDPLTSVYNRRFLFNRLSAEMERHSRSGMTLGVLMLDLDHFKQINDRFGHPVGDEVLTAVARCLENTGREGDLVARMGGEEFAVLVVDATPEGPELLANRLCARLRNLEIFTEAGEPVPISASIGVVCFAGGLVDSDTLIRLADQALYQAKDAGRDRVCSTRFTPLPQKTFAKPGAPCAEEQNRCR
ncbi:MAG: GGDEF domain-containing protein [Pseudomonadales bacterium]